MNKKVPIIIAVILFVIGIILYFVFRETKQEVVKSDINYLVIGNESIWENKNNSWKKVTYDDVNNKKLNVLLIICIVVSTHLSMGKYGICTIIADL